MKIEDIFKTKIKSNDVIVTYKGFNFTITQELIEDLKFMYDEEEALEKLKSYLDADVTKKHPTYGEKKMIELEKNYKITFTEQQAKELYRLLQTERDSGCLTPDKELVLVYHELKKLFDSGIR